MTNGLAHNRTNRIPYIDAIRVLAIALVIVNHTVNAWLLSLGSQNLNWWFGIIYFFCCKIAVPLFVMVSGALLLPRIDTYEKVGKRIVRIILALLAASVFYYYFKATDQHSVADFISRFWHADINWTLWYLYMYVGLLAMLPVLQRLVDALKPADYMYFFAICFGFVNLVPAIEPFYPAITYTSNLELPLFSSYIGMFMIGHYIANIASPPSSNRAIVVAASVFLVNLTFLILGTDYFYDLRGGMDYFVLDNRGITPIVVMASCVFFIARCISERRISETRAIFEIISDSDGANRRQSVKSPQRSSRKLLNTIAVCSFGMYLVHSFFVLKLRPYFFQACDYMPDIVALIAYELIVFIISLAISWLFRLIPPVRKVL